MDEALRVESIDSSNGVTLSSEVVNDYHKAAEELSNNLFVIVKRL